MHKPVLKQEAVELWKGKGLPGVYIDGTFGEGGHSKDLLDKCPAVVIGVDRDGKRISKAKKAYSTLINSKRLALEEGSFASLKKIVKNFQEKEHQKIRGVLLDLGIGSFQLTEGRGFSFKELNDPLDMRYSKKDELTAADILNQWKAEDIRKILKEKGEERYAGRIARAIDRRRKVKKFSKVKDLTELLEKEIGGRYRGQRIHFATRTFQALRMTVNQEEEHLRKGLNEALEVMDKDGRIVVISFHSGEDRIVKHWMKEKSRACSCPPELPVCRCSGKPSLKILTKHPVTPSAKEISNNHRARSAKLRAAAKLA